MRTPKPNRTAIFSVKPKYAALIFSGSKTVELRRIMPRRIRQGSRILFWESAPGKRLAGYARVEAVVSSPIEELWRSVSNHAGISREEFDDYFEGKDSGVAVYLSDAVEFRKKPQLSALRSRLGFQPPQSFRYVSTSEWEYLRRRATLAEQRT